MLTVDTAPFAALCRDLAALSGASVESTIGYEAAKVLETALRLTPVVKLPALRKKILNARAITTDIGSGRKVYFLDRRYSPAVWQRLQTARTQRLKAKVGARGVTRQSWYLLCRELGFAVDVPAYVRRATPSDGRRYDNVRASRTGRRARFTIRVSNAMPVLLAPIIGGDRILARAIARRRAYFRRNVRQDVFRQLGTIARRYPGIRTA